MVEGEGWEEKKTWFVATTLIFLEATRDSNIIVWDSKKAK